MLYVTPIASTAVDWQTYLKTVSESLGRSSTASLDNQWHEIKFTLPEYLATLREIINPGSPPFEAVGHLLSHLHQTFVVVATKSTIIELISTTRLHYSFSETAHPDYYLLIISGTLTEWRTALLNCCTTDVNGDVRSFGTKAMEYFEKVGLRQMMAGLYKIPMADGSVRLIEKKY